MAPTSYSHIGGGLYAPGCLERIKSAGKEIRHPSNKTTFVCLPVPSKPLTRLGSAQRQQSLVPLPLPLSLFPRYSLPFCSSSFASTMQTFSGLSAPPFLRETVQNPRTLTDGHVSIHRSANEQKKSTRLCQRQNFCHTQVCSDTQCACFQPASVCCINTERWTKNKSRRYINSSPLEKNLACTGKEMCTAPINGAAPGIFARMLVDKRRNKGFIESLPALCLRQFIPLKLLILWHPSLLFFSKTFQGIWKPAIHQLPCCVWLGC